MLVGKSTLIRCRLVFSCVCLFLALASVSLISKLTLDGLRSFVRFWFLVTYVVLPYS